MVWYQKKANKYGAKKTVFNGIQYDSKLEAGYAQDLDLLLKAKEIKKVERQITFRLYIDPKNLKLNDKKGVFLTSYRADFVVTLPDGRKQIHEPKGVRTPDFNRKWRLMELLHGNEYDLILIKQ